jgi:hypothetical protein
VMMSGEHFSNFFYDNLPQIVIGLGEGHVGPREKWLKVPELLVPGEPGLASHRLLRRSQRVTKHRKGPDMVDRVETRNPSVM